MYASGACFATISARAPFAPRVEQLASRSIRDAILHPRGSRIERKREPATLVRCEFQLRKQAILSFQPNCSGEVDAANLWHTRWSLCAPKSRDTIEQEYLESPKGCKVVRSKTDLECQEAPDPGPNVRSPCSLLPTAECQPLVFPKGN